MSDEDELAVAMMHFKLRNVPYSVNSLTVKQRCSQEPILGFRTLARSYVPRCESMGIHWCNWYHPGGSKAGTKGIIVTLTDWHRLFDTKQLLFWKMEPLRARRARRRTATLPKPILKR